MLRRELRKLEHSIEPEAKEGIAAIPLPIAAWFPAVSQSLGLVLTDPHSLLVLENASNSSVKKMAECPPLPPSVISSTNTVPC